MLLYGIWRQVLLVTKYLSSHSRLVSALIEASFGPSFGQRCMGTETLLILIVKMSPTGQNA